MNREQHLRQFQISVQRLRLRYSKPGPLTRNILFSVSRGGWAGEGGNHIQKEMVEKMPVISGGLEAFTQMRE